MRQRGIRFPILSDPKSEIIEAFGVRDSRYGPGSYGHGLARPITLVIDPAGIVRHRFTERNYRQRPDVDRIIGVLRQEG